MPELPEVETSKRYIKHFLLNSKITNIQPKVSKLRWKINPDIKKIFNNTIILKIRRIGKYILLNSSNFRYTSSIFVPICIGISRNLGESVKIIRYKIICGKL